MIYIHNNLLDELKQPGGVRLALQRAIELEHATLPTYLYSYYSLGSDFNKPLASLMFSVIFEEMLHFCIACNVLNAIGGSPCIDKPDFIPTFPGRLPGGVETKLKVHLKKFSKQHVKNTFMEIEEPEKPIEPPIRTMTAGVPAAEINLTIGQYYQAILGELENQPFHGDPSKQVVRVFPNAELFPVTDFYSARKAIVIIADQGEGTSLDAFRSEERRVGKEC